MSSYEAFAASCWNLHRPSGVMVAVALQRPAFALPVAAVVVAVAAATAHVGQHRYFQVCGLDPAGKPSLETLLCAVA